MLIKDLLFLNTPNPKPPPYPAPRQAALQSLTSTTFSTDNLQTDITYPVTPYLFGL